MKIGSHDSLTYLKTYWYLRPFKFMAKCQSKTIQEQYMIYGVRMFDFRIKFTKKGFHIAHGYMKFKGDIHDFLRYLNDKQDVIVRILIENKPDRYKTEFQNFCNAVENTYKNIRFCGGRNKHNWQVYYQFSQEDPTYLDKYASNNVQEPGKHWSGCRLDDIWPWIYAKLYNKKNIQKGTDKEFLLIDFVNIR